MATLPAICIGDVTERMPLVTGPELQLPSVWRVLLVLVFAGAVAFAVVLLLKRMKPWLSKQGIGISGPAGITVVAHRKLARSLNIYIVVAEDQRFIIVHSPQSTVISRVEPGAAEIKESVARAIGSPAE